MSATGTELQLGPSFGTIDPSLAAGVVFFLAILIAIIFTLIVAYHWLRYGHRSPLSIPALVLHVFVSLSFLLFAATGLPA